MGLLTWSWPLIRGTFLYFLISHTESLDLAPFTLTASHHIYIVVLLYYYSLICFLFAFGHDLLFCFCFYCFMYFFFPIMLLGEGAVGLSSINSRCLRGFIQIYLCQWIYWEKGIGKQKLCVFTVFCISPVRPTYAYLIVGFYFYFVSFSFREWLNWPSCPRPLFW